MTRRANDEAASPATVRVIMAKSMRGSEDGIHIQQYNEGETYELGDALAQSFLGSKCARPAPEKPAPPAGNLKTKRGKGPDEDK